MAEVALKVVLVHMAVLMRKRARTIISTTQLTSKEQAKVAWEPSCDAQLICVCVCAYTLAHLSHSSTSTRICVSALEVLSSNTLDISPSHPLATRR